MQDKSDSNYFTNKHTKKIEINKNSILPGPKAQTVLHYLTFGLVPKGKEDKMAAAKKKQAKMKAKSKSAKQGYEQFSFMWTVKTILHLATFGMVKPPKTIRATDYRVSFLNKNPGLITWKYKSRGKVREDGLFLCAYCLKPINRSHMQVDHIVPVSKGGINATINLVPACKRCNSAECKGDKTGFWVVRGIFGKVVYTTLQCAFNLITGIFTQRKDIFSRLSLLTWAGVAAYGIYIFL